MFTLEQSPHRHRLNGPVEASSSSSRPSSDSVDGCDYIFIDEFTGDGAGEVFMAVMPPTKHTNQQAPPSGLPAYFAHLWTLPVLSHDQEQHCFRKLNYLKYLLANSQSKQRDCPAIDAMQDDSEALRESIIRTRNFLVESNLRLVMSIAKRHRSPTSESFDELVSAGNTTLMRAVDLFDYRRGNRFSTYAYQAVERSIFTLFRRDRRYRREIEIAEEGLLDICNRDAGESDRAELDANEATEQVSNLIAQLDVRDRYIVMARFGINRSRAGVAFHVIAKEVKLSTTRTVQLFNRSIEKMRLSLLQENAG